MSDQKLREWGKPVLWLGLMGALWGLAACSGVSKDSTEVLHPDKKPVAAAKKKPAAVSKKPSSRKTVSKKTVKYLGMRIPPLPKGHETEVGYLLEPEGPGNFAIEVVKVGSQKLVWMERLLYHDDNGRAHWKIIAVLPPRKVPEGFFFSGGNCQSRGRPDPEIVALYKLEDKKQLTHIRKAWKANPQTQHFEEVSTQGIRCINDAWNRL